MILDAGRRSHANIGRSRSSPMRVSPQSLIWTMRDNSALSHSGTAWLVWPGLGGRGDACDEGEGRREGEEGERRRRGEE